MKTDLEIHTYVEFSMSGFFFSESTSRMVDNLSREEIVALAPSNAFAMRTYQVAQGKVAVGHGGKKKVSTEPFNRSPLTYLGGRVVTLDQLKAEGAGEILIANMECNGWPFVIQCRTGNWQPFDPEKGETVLEIH